MNFDPRQTSNRGWNAGSWSGEKSEIKTTCHYYRYCKQELISSGRLTMFRTNSRTQQLARHAPFLSGQHFLLAE